MKAGTLFSGIGAPECAAPDIDWRWCAEIDPFASAVHAARFPGVVNLGDVEQIDAGAVEPVDLIVFGSPCQSFSVAGKRLGLDDPRGNLALVGLRLIGRMRPRWVVWENVPGVLSSDGGRDFGAFLGCMAELGYGFAYRILDAQHFRIPQRRRRVFVVGCAGSWQRAAAVLFEPESLRGDPAPRREAGKDAACGAGDGSSYSIKTPGSGGAAPIIPVQCNGSNVGTDLPSLRAGNQHITGGGPAVMTLAIRGRGDSHDLEYRDDGTANAILTPNGGRAGIGVGAVACIDMGGNKGMTGGGVSEGFTPPLGTRDAHAILPGMSVRRLLPVECEKLQGFPPGWTDITYRGKPAADGPRYRALGNSMAVPVIGWILQRVRQCKQELGL